MIYFYIVVAVGALTGLLVMALNIRVDHRTRRDVFDNLDNALSNGYFDFGQALYNATPAELAYDLSQDSADFNGVHPDTLTQHVRAWQRTRKPT